LRRSGLQFWLAAFVRGLALNRAGSKMVAQMAGTSTAINGIADGNAETVRSGIASLLCHQSTFMEDNCTARSYSAARSNNGIRALVQRLQKAGGSSAEQDTQTTVPMRWRMSMRYFSVLFCLVAFVWPDAVNAQQRARIAQIGILLPGSQEAYSQYLSQFVEGLRDLGHVPKKSFVLHPRWANGQLDRLPALATELVESKVDVLVVSSSGAAVAAQKATAKIPIVQASGGDPIVSGVAATYARPQGNVTGISNLAEELSEKTLEKLLLLAPNVRRVGVMINPDNVAHQHRLIEIRRAADVLRVHAIALIVPPANLEQVFDTITADDIGGLIVLSDATFLTERRKIIDLAAKAHVPAIYQIREFVFDGGLMSYGINIGANYRRAATLVDRILKGATPAELPIERPARFELVINLKTVEALGRKVPRILLTSADTIVE
jgi:putative ABC transport system substrate-binding protein